MFRLLLFILLPNFLFCQETVFCLHGFMRKPTSMEGMAKAMRREGYQVNNWGYPSRQNSVEGHAEALVEELKQVAKRNPNEPIHFITHSLGGIIIRAALNHPECPDEAKEGRAVLLAPPNQGARFGRFLGHLPPFRKLLGEQAGAQILDSQDFHFVGEFPPSKKVLIISGTFGFNPFSKGVNDGKVGVKESCLNTPHEHWTHFSGHSWIMYNDTVIYRARDFIMNR